MIRRSMDYCPKCNAGFWVEAGILADDGQYRCGTCGALIDVKLRWGKIKSISLVPVVKDEYKGYGGRTDTTTTPRKTAWELADDKWWRDAGSHL